MRLYPAKTRGAANTWKLSTALILLPALAFCLSGCHMTHRGTADVASSPHAHSAQLQPSQGKKWVVDKPMMAHIRHIQTSVRQFDWAPDQDHAVMATQIQEDLGRLVTNCTMEGQAHDELHKWLMPFLALSTEYAEATDPRVQREKLGEIKEALTVFDQHFE